MTNKQKTRAKINQAIFRVAGIFANDPIKGPEDLRPEYTLMDDLGADSLDVVEVVIEIEDNLNIEIPDEMSEDWKTVEDIYQTVEKLTE